MEVKIKLLLVSSFSGLIPAQHFKREKQGLSFAKFERLSSIRLTGGSQFKLANFKVSRVGECTFECINNQECYSVNFGGGSFDQNGKHSCELLKTDKFTRSKSLVASQEFDHYYIKTPCMKDPCQNGATCSAIYHRDEYQCMCLPGYTGQHCETINWIQMTPSTVCFGSKGDTFGNFTTSTSGDVITFKLVYKSGYIACKTKPRYSSHWGCHHPIVPAGFNMGTLLTDTQRRRLLPKDEFIYNVSSSKSCVHRFYYKLPGININSPVLLFDNFSTPFPVTSGEQLQIWFAEDLGSCYEADNDGGKTCVTVFGLFV